MTTYSEVADPPVSPDVERLIAEARMAYVDFLTSLRAAIHLDEGIENVSTALESLLTIGENWAVIREINFDLTVGLPFARQSEIDLVATLLGLAAYSFPFEDTFVQIREAFLETLKSIRTDTPSSILSA